MFLASLMRLLGWEVRFLVDVYMRGTYLWDGCFDGSEANGIIRNPKLELESSHFTFDLVPLSYESVDVVVGENWLLIHKAEMICHEKVVKMPWSSYARAMVELRADVELKDTLVVIVPKFVGKGYTMSTIRIEYEWTPTRCSTFKVFGHILDECPKKIVSVC
ncbi:hypothetical protein Tco_1078980 [Tanacetum coccineum]|uniref:Uncharacterized protein n=1 Tax=Tanacetum coccineum TaxID=301880 RepID=A0ABQ5HS46_9ASTR